MTKQWANELASRILLGLTPTHPELWRSHIVSVLTAPNAHEPSEQRKLAEDVSLYGTGFAMHTAAGMKRLAPEDVLLRTLPRCLAMINEFGDKVCSLPESHGGPHVWVDPQGASRDASAGESGE